MGVRTWKKICKNCFTIFNYENVAMQCPNCKGRLTEIWICSNCNNDTNAAYDEKCKRCGQSRDSTSSSGSSSSSSKKDDFKWYHAILIGIVIMVLIRACQ